MNDIESYRPSVSVIIPTYKPGDYIFKCLDTFFGQTLDHTRFELIIVLNGDKQPYYDTLTTYIGRFNGTINVKLLYSDCPGVSNARNVGIDAATGDYIAFIDDDDWVSSTYLEKMLSKAGPRVVALSNVIAVDDSTGQPVDYFITDAYKRNSETANPSSFHARSFMSVVCCKLIPRDVISSDRFDTDFKLGEDSLYMFQLSRRVGRLSLTSDDAVYYVRLRPNSAMHTHYSRRYRIRLALATMSKFTVIYLRHPLQYNLLFFLSRIFATFRKVFYKEHQ